MEELFAFYSDKVENGHDVRSKFENFFAAERKTIESWYDKFRQNKLSKDNKKANRLKNEGNEYYRRKNFNEALELYSRALRYAEPESETYSLILSNRSAVFYMEENYENCLTDLKLCLSANCSEDIQLKARIRMIKCLSRTNCKDELLKMVEETLKILQESRQILNKDQIKCDILASSKEKPTGKSSQRTSDNPPDVRPKNGFNENFLGASSAIRLDYDDERGRHVVANEIIEKGDVLFVEKAFAFATVFDQNRELPSNVCYHCLRTAWNSLPCKYCVECLFCDDSCRDNSWEEFHKFECPGMQVGLWYNTGIAFPALRALIKGVASNFSSLPNNRADTSKYGNNLDNYPYFDKLVSNLSKMDNIIPILVTTSVIIVYLKVETHFFDLIKKFSVGEIGGLLVRHVAQFQCNSSLISHKGCSQSVAIACGIYPSVSMMNHSCKSNIVINYHQDTAVVKAAQKIGIGEEVFNCYGIDCRDDDLETRQEKCRSIYFFTCNCNVCKHEIQSN